MISCGDAIEGDHNDQDMQALECQPQDGVGGAERQTMSVRASGQHAHVLKSWKEAFLRGGAKAFQSAETAKETALIGKLKALKAKIGELVMGNDFLYMKIDRLENGVAFHLISSTH